MANRPQFSFIQQWMNLIGLLKYGIIFSALLIFLPLSAIKGMPLNGMVGGLFSGLSGWEIFWASIALMASAWSVMFTEGLIVDGVESRWKRGGPIHRLNPQVRTGYVPGWAEEFFSVPVSRPQLAAFSLLAFPGILIILWFADTSWPFRIIGAVIGVVVAYVIMVILCAPARLADPTYKPLPDLPLAEWIWSRLAIRPLKWVFKLLRRCVSWVLWWVPLIRYLFRPLLVEVEEDGKRRLLLLSDHFFAITNVGLLLVLLAVVASIFYPGSGWREPPAVGYIYILITLIIWTFAALHFHLARFRISPLLALLLIMVLGYSFTKEDHYYLVSSKTPGEDQLTPVDVAKGSKGGRNLVVIASSGGGILAAGWTTLALENLIAARPGLVHEIRLLSTISGGSVGAAHYIDGLLRAPQDSFKNIHVKSTTSSLAATAYGFAFLDFWRLVSGGWLNFSKNDRGVLLEKEWERIATGKVTNGTTDKATGKVQSLSLLSLREDIRKGLIPAPIFGATVMESGRRVMITPIDFSGLTSRHTADRAETLFEFLSLDGGKQETDMSLWTAARLSANFAYVSPAAGAKFESGAKAENQQKHHIIDGGYYDNFGVTSALDWLEPVLQARLKEEEKEKVLQFDRVLVVQLRAFHEEDPKKAKPKSGSASALLGPLIGLERIRSGAAISRDEIDLERFIRSWNDRLKQKNIGVCLRTVVFEPPEGEQGPLSWHLTKEQKDALIQSWYKKGVAIKKPDDPTTWADELHRQWIEMNEHLTRKTGC